MIDDNVLFRDDVRDIHRPYAAKRKRYANTRFRRVGASGLHLPPISLGLWWNFGDNVPIDDQRMLLRHAFDKGITHFDLANNYGPPYGSAEKNFGRIYGEDLRPYRDELIISTKAGWDMWPGPYGDLASRKYIIASAEQSLRRMGLDYVDIFYSHRVDPVTPIEETVAALDHLVRQGKALYVGISSYSAARTQKAHAVATELGTPLIIHQPAYSILNRWIEDGLIDTLREAGMGAIAFTPLAQGLLTDKYLGEGPVQRAQKRSSLPDSPLTDQGRKVLRGLNELAAKRGQTLAQLAIQWTLRDPIIASALTGASRTEQLDENLAALESAPLSDDECAMIDAIARGVDVDYWAESSQA